MNDKDRELIRTFYQSIPTAEEKEAFYSVMCGTKAQRIQYLANACDKSDILPEATLKAIIAATVLTKEDRVMIFSGVARQLIFKFLSFLGL